MDYASVCVGLLEFYVFFWVAIFNEVFADSVAVVSLQHN